MPVAAFDADLEDLIHYLNDLRPSEKVALQTLAQSEEGGSRIIAAAEEYLRGWTDPDSLDWYKVNRAGLWISRNLPAALVERFRDMDDLRGAKSVLPLAERLQSVDHARLDAWGYFWLGLDSYRSKDRTSAELV